MSLRERFEEMVREGSAPAHTFPEGWRVPTSPKMQEELHLWHQWKESGEKEEHLQPLLTSLQPLLHQRIRDFSGRVPIPKEVLHAQATNLTIQGLRRYDPTKAQLATYLTTQLRGLRRYVIQHQNVSRITEERAHQIGPYQHTVAELTETLSRPPTTHEIADHMQVSVKTVNKLALEIREDLLASGSPVEDPFLDEVPRAREVLQLIQYELTPSELLVFERLTGTGGHAKLSSTGAISKALGMSDSKVSQLKNAISRKMKEYL